MDKKSLLSQVKFRRIHIKQVSWIPHILVRIRGKRDMKNGIEVCRAFVEKKIRLCGYFEHSEYSFIERLLNPMRVKSATLVQNFRNAKVRLKDPEVSAVPGSSSAQKRTAKMDGLERAGNRNVLSASVKELAEIEEIIIAAEQIIRQRTEKARKKTSAHLCAYIAGVQSQGTLSEPLPFSFADDAFEIYREKHAAGDTWRKTLLAMSDQREKDDKQ